MSQRTPIWQGLGFGILFLLSATRLPAQRTVTPVEKGSMFMTPDKQDWSRLGIFIGSPKWYAYFKAMRPDAIKVAHGRFQHFSPHDANAYAYFPYHELKTLEASEVAAGREPIFVTATYQGKKRPVYFKWSLGSPADGKPPTTPQENWAQAVNVGDPRFLRFWIDQYVHKVWDPTIKNMWMGLDDCAFDYSLYGVVDDNGNFVSKVSWDRPFATTEEEFFESIKTFFRRLKTTAPDIKTICNMGSPRDWQRFGELFADTAGILNEDIVYFTKLDKPYIRQRSYQVLKWLQWASNLNKVELLRAFVPKDDPAQLVTAVSTYLLVRGDNSFFAPQTKEGKDLFSPEQVAALMDPPGKPLGKMQVRREPGSPNEGFALMSRQCTNGIVFVNMSGKNQTITLPADRTCYDRNGNRVSELRVNDLRGDYVLFSPVHPGLF